MTLPRVIPQVIERVNHFFISNTLPRLLFIFIFFFLFFSFYFFLHTFTSTDDQFFNIRLAQKISVEGFSALQNFNEFSAVVHRPWVFNILFYYLLIPFTWFHPLELGIKVFAVASLAFTLTTLFFFLEKNNIKKSFFWLLFALGFFSTPPDIWHFLMARAFVLVPALLVLVLYSLQKEKYVALFLLSFASFFLHTATFFLPLVVGIIFSAFSWQAKKRFPWALLMSLASGTAAALLLGMLYIPGFLDIIWHFWISLYEIVTSFHISNTVQIDEGVESYPITLFDTFPYHAVLIGLIFLFSPVALIRMLRLSQEGKSFGNPVFLTLLVLTLLFLLGTFITKRNFDFFYIFSSLFLIFTLSDFFKEIGLKEGIKEKKVYIFSGVVVLLVALTSQVLAIMDMIAASRDQVNIKGVALWAREHTEKGSVVFNPTMNFFPTFYFYNEGYNRMIVGIEPRDLYKTNPRKYWLWYNFSTYGIVCGEQQCAKEIALRDAMLQSQKEKWYQDNGEAVANLLLNEFATNLVLVRSDFITLQTLLENSPYFEEVYATPVIRDYILYRVKDN